MEERTVLIVEDDPASAELYKTALKGEGLDVLHRTSSELLGGELLDTRTCTAMVVSIGSLDEEDARRLLERMASMEEPVPTVLLTSSELSTEDLPEGLESIRCLTRPFSILRLVEAVEDMLRACEGKEKEEEKPAPELTDAVPSNGGDSGSEDEAETGEGMVSSLQELDEALEKEEDRQQKFCDELIKRYEKLTAELEKEIGELRARLEAAKGETEQRLEEERKRATEKKRLLREEMDKLNEENETLSRRLSLAEKDVSKLEEERKSLRKRIEELEHELEEKYRRLEEQKAALERELEETNRRLLEMEVQRQALREKLEKELQRQSNRLMVMAEAHEHLAKESEKLIENLEQTIARLKQELSASEERGKKLEEENRRLKERIDTLEGELLRTINELKRYRRERG